MKPPATSLAKVLELAPPCLVKTIPAEWADANGHMNMRWYVALFDDASDDLHVRLGLTREFHGAHGTGTFDLEHHTHFLNECLPGDSVTVYVRMLANNAKRFHYLMFLVNDTRQKLASIFECVNGLVDLKVRRTIPYPPEVLATIEAAVAATANLDWEAPVCGVMRA